MKQIADIKSYLVGGAVRDALMGLHDNDLDYVVVDETPESMISAGYKPIRVMFYYPQRQQAMKIQKALETLYKGAGGEYHWGDNAWGYVEERTGINLKGILERIAEENAHEDETH